MSEVACMNVPSLYFYVSFLALCCTSSEPGSLVQLAVRPLLEAMFCVLERCTYITHAIESTSPNRRVSWVFSSPAATFVSFKLSNMCTRCGFESRICIMIRKRNGSMRQELYMIHTAAIPSHRQSEHCKYWYLPRNADHVCRLTITSVTIAFSGCSHLIFVLETKDLRVFINWYMTISSSRPVARTICVEAGGDPFICHRADTNEEPRHRGNSGQYP